MAAKHIDYVALTSKYTSNVNTDAVNALVKYCGIALRSRDARYVAATDHNETDRIVKGYCAKKLGLDKEAATSAVAAAALKMKQTRMKNRVPFYYLIAEHAGKLASLHIASEHARTANVAAPRQVAPGASTSTPVLATVSMSTASPAPVTASVANSPVRTAAPVVAPVVAPVMERRLVEVTAQPQPVAPTFIAQSRPIAQPVNKININSFTEVAKPTTVITTANDSISQFEATTPGFFARIKAWFNADNATNTYRPN